MNRTKKIYVNDAQLEFLESRARRKTFIMGRGGGKSFTIGLQTGMCALQLPRARMFLAGVNFGQVLNVTLPDMELAWNSMGFFPYDPKTKMGHYIKWKQPPEHFHQPYSRPNDFEKIISWVDGFTLDCLSIVKGEHNRGGSFDGGFIDESGTVKRDVVYKVLRTKIRGNEFRYDSHLHGIFADFTSSPWLQSGKWVYETEYLAQQDPENYFFIERSGEINKGVLGARYFKNLRSEMTQLEYDVEVRSKRVNEVPNGYYPTFNEERHLAFDTQGSFFDEDKGIHITPDNWLDNSKSLDMSWDFNAGFTSCLVAQELGNELRIDDNLFVKECKEESLERALTKKFCEKYSGHGHKHVNLYGDRTGNHKSSRNPLTAYQEIQQVLKEYGWASTIKAAAFNEEHHIRQSVIADILAETKPRVPKVRINANKCKALITAIKNTPILPDYKKDKRSEGTDMPQEHATHLPDCLDYLLFTKYSGMFGASITQDIAPIFLGR